LTDIHDRAARPRKDVQNGDHGAATETPRRSFSDEYKAEVVDLCRTSDKSISEVARDLGLTVSAVRRWVAQDDVDAGGARDDLNRVKRTGLTSFGLSICSLERMKSQSSDWEPSKLVVTRLSCQRWRICDGARRR